MLTYMRYFERLLRRRMDALDTVRSYMTQNVVTVYKYLVIHKAIDKLLRHHISDTPVNDDTGHRLGFLLKKIL